MSSKKILTLTCGRCGNPYSNHNIPCQSRTCSHSICFLCYNALRHRHGGKPPTRGNDFVACMECGKKNAHDTVHLRKNELALKFIWLIREVFEKGTGRCLTAVESLQAKQEHAILGQMPAMARAHESPEGMVGQRKKGDAGSQHAGDVGAGAAKPKPATAQATAQAAEKREPMWGHQILSPKPPPNSVVPTITNLPWCWLGMQTRVREKKRRAAQTEKVTGKPTKKPYTADDLSRLPEKCVYFRCHHCNKVRVIHDEHLACRLMLDHCQMPDAKGRREVTTNVLNGHFLREKAMRANSAFKWIRSHQLTCGMPEGQSRPESSIHPGLRSKRRGRNERQDA